ncbi:MAG: GLUG motif-containing protein, partial [Planctomycetota bacterium]
MCGTRISSLLGKITIWFVICCFCLPAQAKYGGGSGTPQSPYQIRDANHMQVIGADANDWDKHFKLMADIDLSAFTGTSFNIIGYYESYYDKKPFTGVFDGNGHAISNFTYDSNGVDAKGLFGYINDLNAEVKNLGLIDPDVDEGTGNYVGSLVGYLRGGTVTSCYVEGGSVSGYRDVGGLVGFNRDGTITDSYAGGNVTGNSGVGGLVGENWYGTIKNCYVKGSVLGGLCVGGLVGSQSGGTITNCYSTCSVSGYEDIGGLVGLSDENTITNCYSFGCVSGNESVGGLVGYSGHWSSEGDTITNCSATGSVVGDKCVGGLVGYNYSTINSCYSTANVFGGSSVGGLVGYNFDTITKCYSTGSVVGNETVGGLVGNNRNGTITNSYSTGSVTGTNYVGGLVGNNRATISYCYSIGSVDGYERVGGLVARNYRGMVLASFWDIETSGLDTSARGTGLPTDQMQMQITFTDADWDFVDESTNGEEDIWKICEGLSYPHLSWETPLFLDAGPDQFFVNVIPSKVILYASSLCNQLSYHQWSQVAGPSVILEGIDDPIVSFIPTEFGVYVFELTASDGQADGTDTVTVSIEERYAGGDGTAQNPCQIRTAEHMNDIGLHPEDWSRHFKLMEDIDLSSFTGASFNIIGGTVCDIVAFSGVFDGNGHTISNFAYASTYRANIGLFGYVRGGKVRDLGLIDPNVDAGTGFYVGSLVGYLREGTITNCYVEGGSVTGEDYVGGLVGWNNYGTITNCYATGGVTGIEDVGGLLGTNLYGAIVNCYSTGSVSGNYNKIGGLVGWSDEGTITKCYSTSSVIGTNYVGGLLGHNGGTITNSYSRGSVVGDNHVGGLVGVNYYMAKITKCYSSGTVSGTTSGGGLVGSNQIGGVTASFWDIDTSGQDWSDGG